MSYCKHLVQNMVNKTGEQQACVDIWGDNVVGIMIPCLTHAEEREKELHVRLISSMTND